MNLNEVLNLNESESAISEEARRLDGLKITKPEHYVELKALHEDSKEVTNMEITDKTDDLVVLPFGKQLGYEDILSTKLGKGYIIHDMYSKETWYAPNEVCLNKNFVYRGDVRIVTVNCAEEAERVWHTFNDDLDYGKQPSKAKYILDDPSSETYWPYSSSDYVPKNYGKSVLEGTVNHKFSNRFQRDCVILALEKKYSTESIKDAREFIADEFGDNEAIIVSDGSSQGDKISYTYYYIDAENVLMQSGCCAPKESKPSATIAEIVGAYYAIKQCVDRGKTKIRYYFDNGAIIDIFRTSKNDRIPEIKVYKEYLKDIFESGVEVEFCDLHPKTATKKYKLSKALTFLHNSCDTECKMIARLYSKGYAKKAIQDDSKGKPLKSVIDSSKPRQNSNYYDKTGKKKIYPKYLTRNNDNVRG